MNHYGLTELAQAVGVSRHLVSQWVRRGKLPEPQARLAMGPLWYGEEIEKWIRERKVEKE